MNEFIQNLAAQKVDLNNLPDTIIFWTGKNKELGDYVKMYNPKTGNIYTEDHCDLTDANKKYRYVQRHMNDILAKPSRIVSDTKYYSVVVARSNDIEMFYIKYHEDSEFLEIAKVMVDAHRAEAGTIREFRKIPRMTMFIKKDFSEIWMPQTYNYYTSELENVNLLARGVRTKHIRRFFQYLNNIVISRPILAEEMEKFTGSKHYLSKGKWGGDREFYAIWNIEDYMRNRLASPAKPDKATPEIEKFLRTDLDLYMNHGTMTQAQRERKSTYSWRNRDLCIAYEKVNDYDVFRMILKETGYNSYGNIYEKYRIVIGPDKKPMVYENYNNKLNRVGTNPDWNGWECKRYNFEAMKDSENLKYVYKIIDKAEDPIKVLIGVFRHPIIEKISKCGYNNITDWLIQDNQIAANLKDLFGVKEKKGDLYKTLGVNKHIMKIIDDNIVGNDNNGYRSHYFSSQCLEILKAVTGVESIATLDKDTCEILLSEIFRLNKAKSNWIRKFSGDLDEDGYALYDPGYYYYNAKNPIILTENARKYVYKLLKNSYKNKGEHDLIEMIIDTISMVGRIRNNEYRPNINFFKVVTPEDARAAHDNVVVLYNRYQEYQRALYDKTQAERQRLMAEKMKKLNKDRVEKFSFEDDDYKIVIPETPVDLINEGTSLSHCVGSYVDRVGNGNTNILFIRDKKHLDSSLMTVEVNNNNQVIQAHARYNAWMGTIPEVIPFFLKWIKAKDIFCDKHIILSTATGYSSSGFKDLDGTPYGI